MDKDDLISKYVSKHLPCFEADSSNIEILETPSQYYQNLKRLFSNAKERILVTSLYLGNGQLEKDLVDSITQSLTVNPNLTVNILLDYSRAFRNVNNSVTMLQPVLKSTQRANLYLYHTPNLRGIIKRFMPQRANEVLGVQHMKVYIADNDLIITGANLSNDYFVNRQDRYMIIKDCKELCDFFQLIFKTVIDFSFKINQDGTAVFNNTQNKQIHPYLGNYTTFSNELSNRIKCIFNKYTTNKFNQSNENKAYIVPLVQYGCANIRMDQELTNDIFRKAADFSKIYLATGYFNLTRKYINSIVNESTAEYQVLTAAPIANGFFNSPGFSKYIPDIYLFLEKKFNDLIKSCRQENRVRIFEYDRNNWTFHAKGLWYYPDKNTELPNLTVIGSSNFGYRSVQRDLEFQLIVFSNNKKFQSALHKEQLFIFENGKNVSETVLTKVKFPLWLRAFSNLFKSFF